MKKAIKCLLIFLISFFLVSCSSEEKDSNSIQESGADHAEAGEKDETVNGFSVGDYQSFDKKRFKEKEVYIKGKIIRVNANKSFTIRDESGRDWKCNEKTNVDLTPYHNLYGECYCLAKGFGHEDSAVFEPIDISLMEDPQRYMLILEDGEIFSYGENCTLFGAGDKYPEKIMAFARKNENGEIDKEEIEILIDFENRIVKEIQEENGKLNYYIGHFDDNPENPADNGRTVRIAFNGEREAYFTVKDKDYSYILYGMNNLFQGEYYSVPVETAQKRIDDAVNNKTIAVDGGKKTEDIKNEDIITTPVEKGEKTETYVWIPSNGGKKYHSSPSCSGLKNPKKVTLEYAWANSYEACKKCH